MDNLNFNIPNLDEKLDALIADLASSEEFCADFVADPAAVIHARIGTDLDDIEDQPTLGTRLLLRLYNDDEFMRWLSDRQSTWSTSAEISRDEVHQDVVQRLAESLDDDLLEELGLANLDAEDRAALASTVPTEVGVRGVIVKSEFVALAVALVAVVATQIDLTPFAPSALRVDRTEMQRLSDTLAEALRRQSGA